MSFFTSCRVKVKQIRFFFFKKKKRQLLIKNKEFPEIVRTKIPTDRDRPKEGLSVREEEPIHDLSHSVWIDINRIQLAGIQRKTWALMMFKDIGRTFLMATKQVWSMPPACYWHEWVPNINSTERSILAISKKKKTLFWILIQCNRTLSVYLDSYDIYGEKKNGKKKTSAQ